MAHQSSINMMKGILQGKERKAKNNTVKSSGKREIDSVHNKIEMRGSRPQRRFFAKMEM